jgi:lysozyme
MKTSKRALQFIRDHEGLRLKAYRCPTGYWTIGYGHTSDAKYPVKPGMVITKAKAEEILLHDVAEAEADINKCLKVSLNGNQYGALCSWVFNLGGGKLKGSSLMKAINKGKKNVTWEFGLWVKGRVNGKLVTLPGLVRRRAEEAALFMTPASLEEKVVVQPKIDEPSEETTDARNQKGGVEQAKDPTRSGLWSLLAGGLMAIVTPILAVYKELQTLTEDIPYLAPALSIAVVLAIAYAIYQYMKDGGQVDFTQDEEVA